MLGDVNKLLKTKSLLKTPSNVTLHLKQTFRPKIWIFTEGDAVEYRLPDVRLIVKQIKDLFIKNCSRYSSK